MVKNFIQWLTLCLLLFLQPLLGVKVTAEIDSARIAENRRLDGKIQVIHLPAEKIDAQTVQLDGKPLSVQKVEEVRRGDQLVTTFRFQIPGRAKGLYGLPAVTIVVDGKPYYTSPSTYEVTSAQASGSLDLETIVTPSTPLYPTQHAVFTYRIRYNKSIELTAEALPLLEAQGFQKVGDKRVKDYQTDDYTIQEISQEVRALEPGQFSYGPSYVEGFSYKEDLAGQRVYEKPRLRADADTVNIAVHAFPTKDRPLSFNGAVGTYQVKSRLTTPGEVNIGDKIEIGFSINGDGNKESLTMPDISCQPGFSGFFEMGTYPYFEQRSSTGKEFVLTFRPLSADLKAIPSIEFSYFDPLQQQYKTVQSEPLPITVRPFTFQSVPQRLGYVEPKTIISASPHPETDHRLTLGKSDPKMAPRSFELAPTDLSPPFGSIQDVWLALAVFPILIGGQWAFKRFRSRKQPLAKQTNSEHYLALAIRSKGESSKVFSYLEKAFYLLLKEKSYTDRVLTSPERLSTEGEVGLVRQFLTELETRRFGKGEQLSDREVLKEAKQLYSLVRYGRG